MAADYPVVFNTNKPEKFDRVQLALRLAVVIVLSILAGAIGWIVGLVYLIFPVLAAIFISSKGAEKFLNEDGPRMTGWLRWVLALYSYLGLLTDKLPTEKPEEHVKYEVTPGGSPTVGSALLRIIFAIPSALVLALLSFVAGILWIIAAIMILIQENYPDGIYNFNLGVMRWEARLLAYLASLVDPYPPFALDTGSQESEMSTPATPSPEPPTPGPSTSE
jgi:hypothetical protein